MATAEVSDHVLDEIWLMMHMAAEIGILHGNPSSADEQEFMLEAEVEDDFLSDTENDIEDDFAGELRPQSKKAALINAAGKLMELGDEYNKELKKSQDLNELAGEIADFIKASLAPKIDTKLQAIPHDMSRKSSSSIFQETGILSLVYDGFKSKVENFVGPGSGLAHVGLITQITKGVGQGLDQSLSGASSLLATMATNLIREKYSSIFQGKKELTQIVRENS